MKFKTLFENCKTQIKDQVKAVWLEDKDLWKGGVTLKDYEEKLDLFLDRCFTGNNILVEDMGEWESIDKNDFPTDLLSKDYWREWDDKEKDSLFGENKALKDKSYSPFKHQIECWRKLLEEKKSICVTTGTGSGKTECFMVPLVKDLADNYFERHSDGQPVSEEPVQAIFLYPLNALMDDQRTRMSEIIECSGKELRFAVYNGNTPDDEYDEKRNADIVKTDRRKHELVFRDEIRGKRHPNIIFTNPTMLEYLLLRKDDHDILKHSQGKLRWIVIDETHTFTGAGAAELALLIRRVLDAFDTPIENVRFATSSATVGGKDGEKELKQFISDITGKPDDRIEVITGCRSLQTIERQEFNELHDKSFLTLDEMIPGNGTVAEKLDIVDNLCEKGLKAKLHFFAKALNRGLYVDMRKANSTKFALEDYIPLDTVTGSYDCHVFEAKYCSHCGTVFTKADITEDNILKRGEITTTSIFDDIDNSSIEDIDDDYAEDENQAVVTDPKIEGSQGEFLIAHRDNALSIAEAWNNQGDKEPISFNLTNEMEVCNDDDGCYVGFVMDEKGKCPVCGEPHAVRPFNVSASKLARILAPYLLEQAQASENNNVLFEGKQMIAFADSRKKAAKPTLEQNKESERNWVEWVIYNKLKEKKSDETEIKDIEEDLEKERERQKRDPNSRHERKIQDLEKQLQDARHKTLSWNDALEELLQDDYCDYFAKQFASNDDLNSIGECKSVYKKQYVLAALYEVFKNRKRKAKNAETQGLIKVVYGEVEKLINEPEEEIIPQSVVNLNKHIHDDNLKIRPADWIDFLTLYIDHKVRTNQCLFYENHDGEWDKIDITACRNLRTEDGVRRTVKKERHNHSFSNRFKELLSQLLGGNYASLDKDEKELIDDVIDSCWAVLLDMKIIERGKQLDQDGNWIEDDVIEDYEPDEQGRMNLTRIQFTLPEENHIWKCPVTNRYLTTVFKGYTPYGDNQRKYGFKATLVQTVEPMQEPKPFIQSEHTAQLGRSLTKERIRDFKDHKINILSCSTTMEMGVDLGSVELVEMTNIPPHPANYKQRAGRAGRRGQTRSACMTICGSDGVDSRFFSDSKGNVTKNINPPTVDLKSPQVLQRHINSYLFKQWCKTINMGSEVKDLFTEYEWGTDENGRINRKIALYHGDGIIPNGGIYLGTNRKPYDESHTYNAPCRDFMIWLQTLDLNYTDSNINKGLERIVAGSIFENKNPLVFVNDTVKAIDRLMENLNDFFLTLREQQETAENFFNNDYTGPDKSNKLEKRIKGLNFNFTSRLSEPLLSYLATHQFLPNANMPVNIVELKVSDANGKFDRNNENPTYDLATAIGQWAPGNYHTIKDTTYQIGGVMWDRKYMHSVKKCIDCKNTWVTPSEECPQCHSTNLITWSVNGANQLKFLTPIAFVPTTDRSRITDTCQNYTSAKAELLGTSEQIMPSKGWFAYRISESNPSSDNIGSNILIYNDGIGYGYQICKHCGKALLEAGVAVKNDLTNIITVYDKTKKGNERVRYHNELNLPCTFNFDKDKPDDKLFRNVIIGGLIQTDYCEINFYRENGLRLQPFDVECDKKILTTLGVLICSYMVDCGICERTDVDFIRMGNGALCIYDKAKGGAGYSRQLDTRISDALDYCIDKLTYCSSLFQILDTYSQRYADQIDIIATLTWLKEEKDHRDDVPKEVCEAYPDAKNSSFSNIAKTIMED